MRSEAGAQGQLVVEAQGGRGASSFVTNEGGPMQQRADRADGRSIGLGPEPTAAATIETAIDDIDTSPRFIGQGETSGSKRLRLRRVLVSSVVVGVAAVLGGGLAWIAPVGHLSYSRLSASRVRHATSSVTLAPVLEAPSLPSTRPAPAAVDSHADAVLPSPSMASASVESAHARRSEKIRSIASKRRATHRNPPLRAGRLSFEDF